MNWQQNVIKIRNDRKILRHNTAMYRAKEATELKNKGLSLREIAKKMKTSHVTISTILDQDKAGRWNKLPELEKIEGAPETPNDL
jgi:transposase